MTENTEAAVCRICGEPRSQFAEGRDGPYVHRDCLIAERQAMTENTAAPRPDFALHNHLTRDIKERGLCPACDEYHDRRDAENTEGPWCPDCGDAIEEDAVTCSDGVTVCCDLCAEVRELRLRSV